MWKYAPDLDPTTPGIITNITGIGLVPTIRGGYRGVYSYVEKWYNSGTDTGFNGGFLGVNTSGVGRLFLCADDTSGRIYEATSTGTRTDRSRGGNYTAGAWFTFCQLDDTTYASNKSDTMQYSSSGAFADLSGSPPKAKIIVADANQIVALNTDTAADGWACCDVGAATTWTATGANEARSGRLRDSGGAITAGCSSPFGGVIAFKKNSMYVGSYVGFPKVREWRKVSDRVGCKWIEGCVNTGEAVYFAGDDIYEFDGSQVRSITEGIRGQLRRLALATNSRVALSYDAFNSLLYVWYNSSSSSFLDNAYCYNTKTGQWGVDNIVGGTINSATNIVGRPVGVLSVTYDEVLNTFSAPTSNRAAKFVFMSDKVASGWKTVSFGGFHGVSPPNLASMSPSTTAWTTSYVGDYAKASTVTRVVPNIVNPTASALPTAVQYAIFSLTLTAKQYTPYGATTGTPSATMSSDYRFHLMAKGHWFSPTYTVDHSVTPSANGNFEWFDHTPEYVPAGKA